MIQKLAMKSEIHIITKFSILFCGLLMPLFLYGQGGPGPPPPPAGVPFDLACGFILAGSMLIAGKKIYSKKEAA